jgi:bacillithiol biosynthesis cysteine-adding enzyme BshC
MGPLVTALDGQWTREAREGVLALLRGRACSDTDRLERFVEQGGFVVTTGQQAGFLTGPLFTISKALGAIAHATRLEAAIGRPVLPVFWVASEDHDWAEAESALFLDRDGTPVRVTAEPATEPANRSVSLVPVNGAERTLATLKQLWSGGALSEQALGLIEAAYPTGETLADGFETLLDELLGRLGLFIVQAHDPTLKERCLPILTAAVEDARTRGDLLGERGAALERDGYHQQVTWAPGATNVFLATPSGRQRLHMHGDGFRLGGEGATLSQAEVLDLMQRDVTSPTPDALLRPVVEASVLPVLAYVAGPGEIAYYAQNGPLYDASDVIRPDVVGRPSVRVVEPKVQKALARIGMQADEIGAPLHELQTTLARSLIPPDVHDIIKRTREALDSGIEALAETATGIDPTMAGPVSQAGRRGQQSLERAEKKIMQAVKRRSSEAMAHLDRARAGLHPEGVPQERAVNIFHFLSRHGFDFVDELNAAIVAQVEQ